MDIWIIATLFAAAVQTMRFMLQKQVKAAGLSTGGATVSRFLFAVPLAALAAVALAQMYAEPWPGFTPIFWIYAAVGGLGQIIGTYCTVTLFSLRNFAVGIAFTKTETVQVALFSLVFLGEAVTGMGLLAIFVGLAGVILISLKPAGTEGGVGSRAVALGLLGGAMFGISAIGYRGATLEVGDGNYLFRAALTLSMVTLLQSVAMSVWLRLREPGELTKVLRSWRSTLPVGVTGMLGSFGWFTAFTLQNAAYVRALGQVELIFGFMVTVLVFRERLSVREIGGGLLLGLSVAMLVLFL